LWFFEWTTLESYHKLQPKAKQISQFKEYEMQLIWAALPEKAINNAVKDFRKQC